MILNAARHRFSVYTNDIEALKVYEVGFHQAQRMIDLNQARLIDGGRCLQLTGIGEPHLCRTHTSRGGALAAMGRSQVYTTTNDIRRVNGFKHIFPEDRNTFYSAVLTNIKALIISLLPGLIMGWG